MGKKRYRAIDFPSKDYVSVEAETNNAMKLPYTWYNRGTSNNSLANLEAQTTLTNQKVNLNKIAFSATTNWRTAGIYNSSFSKEAYYNMVMNRTTLGSGYLMATRGSGGLEDRFALGCFGVSQSYTFGIQPMAWYGRNYGDETGVFRSSVLGDMRPFIEIPKSSL